MRSPPARARRRFVAALACLAAVGAAVLVTSHAGAQDTPAGVFGSPEAAAQALVEAAAKNDDAALLAVLGPAARDLIQSGKDPAVSKERAEFAAAAEAGMAFEDNADGSKTLVVGDDAWPLPFPLVKQGSAWRFGIEAGREEVLARRIGRHELRAIQLCSLYLDAQAEYASVDRDGDGVREYARKIRSTPGQKDGLYWETGADGEASPLGPLVASWREHLTGSRGGASMAPVGGYYFRVLQGQGGSAPGGRHTYVINGNMIAGCALVAYPAVYRKTGVMTFIVSHHGKVYERDLGICTERYARCMIGFNPTAGWVEVPGEE
jgi:hypothetical protein